MTARTGSASARAGSLRQGRRRCPRLRRETRNDLNGLHPFVDQESAADRPPPTPPAPPAPPAPTPKTPKGFALVGVGNCLPNTPNIFDYNCSFAHCAAVCANMTHCVGVDWAPDAPLAGSCRARFPVAPKQTLPAGFQLDPTIVSRTIIPGIWVAFFVECQQPDVRAGSGLQQHQRQQPPRRLALLPQDHLRAAIHRPTGVPQDYGQNRRARFPKIPAII